MDVFGLHDRLIEDYQQFTRSFVDIHDERIAETVELAIDDGLLWPEPWIQLNPNFEPGATPDELVERKVLHPECARIFRTKSEYGDHGRGLRFHRHQTEAIEAARSGANYVLTTGTGSGKSLAYIAPIVDRVLRDGPGHGLRALVVYPMNALANSQALELEKFIDFGYPKGQAPLRYARYTGQESDEEREAILTNPPDIVLTNYVMLELILTRPRERKRLVGAARGNLQFLVLDELHTYRGRQGADVGMLVRRLREACAAPTLQVVGTSATMASGGSRTQERHDVAEVATRLFGDEVLVEHVIGETLRRATPELDLKSEGSVRALTDRVAKHQSPPSDPAEYLKDPLSSWIETTFGLARAPDTDELVRGAPRAIAGADGVAVELGALTGQDPRACASAIQAHLLGGYRALDVDTARPVFAFRVHQFLTKGDTAYATLEPEDVRYITVQGQTYKPGDRGRILLPLAFCRECGQEYYTITRRLDETLDPRDFGDRSGDAEHGATPGFLCIQTDHPWPAELSEVHQRLPESWLIEEGGHVRIDPNRRDDVPRSVGVDPSGRIDDDGGTRMTWLPAPFRFCLNCGVSYDPSMRSDLSKLSQLSTEGRSSATSLLSLSLVRSLRSDHELAPEARKLLSFTDNRQDASLQAGHFNDFVQIGLLRGALSAALRAAAPDPLRSDDLVGAVFDALSLPFADFAQDPEVKFAARAQTERAFRSMLGYRLYQDLRRGWRVTMPNLEQSGLLRIERLSRSSLILGERPPGTCAL